MQSQQQQAIAPGSDPNLVSLPQNDVNPSEKLKRNVKVHTIICGVSAALGILFFPLVLLVFITRCYNCPSSWNWEGINPAIQQYSKNCKTVVMLIFFIGVAIWSILSGLSIGFFGVGIIMLVIVALCTICFIIVANIPYHRIRNGKKPTETPATAV